MQRNLKSIPALTIMMLALLGCGGGGGDGEVKGTDSQVVADITSSNIQSWGNSASGTNRWVGVGSSAPQVSVFIPATSTPAEADLAAKSRLAIASINRKLGGSVLLSEVNSAPASGGYMRVSYLTSYVPTGSTDYASYCANVSTGSGLPNPVDPTPTSGSRNDKVAWLNLGNGRCDVTQNIVIHEMGHALGLNKHFQGFGFPDALSTQFWDVLATLYGNPVRTPAAQLMVRRAVE